MKEDEMLIDVFAGHDRNSAAPRGSFHFARSPKPGEHVEIDGTVLIVTRAWHRPDIYYRGAKFAILVGDPVDRGGPAIPIHDHAEAVA
jgi:hypothetical protein